MEEPDTFDEEGPCEHDWLTTCDGVEHTDECQLCGLVVCSPCPDTEMEPPDSDTV